ncbi:protein HSH49-like [Aristolochia californica]|uniref:protein HSH49-like n=1 Tax=Aristolochia californica TaxID=171875 RepID=UPI0035DECFC6
MRGSPGCTVYIGNLDEKVSERVLYEIMIQAGHIVDLYIPKEKETNRPKGYAFAEYGTEEIADYAVRLFSGLVSLYKKTLKFAISGQDKTSQTLGMHASPISNSFKKRLGAGLPNENEKFQESTHLPSLCRISAYSQPQTPNYPKASPGLVSNGSRSDLRSTGFDYSRRVIGATMDSIRRNESHSSRVVYDSRLPVTYPSY